MSIRSTLVCPLRWISALCLALVLTACVHEELRPVRETTLTVARVADEITLSWIGQRGTYYTVMYSPSNGAKAAWKPLPDAVNIQAQTSGESIVVHDRIGVSRPRYYRLLQNANPIPPAP